jgi:hypothetical protein
LLKLLAPEGLCREIWHRWQVLPGEDPAARMVLLEQAYQAMEQAPTAALIERRSHPCRRWCSCSGARRKAFWAGPA